MTSRQRLLIGFAAVNLLILVIGWFALVSPQRGAAASASAQQQTVQAQLAALTGTSQIKPTQPAIHTSDLYALDTALPSQQDQPELLFLIDRLAKASDVEVLGVTPDAMQATTSYTVQPISLQLSGSYFHLTRFLRSIRILVTERQGRLIANGPLFAVTSVALSPSTTTTAAGKTKTSGEIANVGLAAFYYGTVGGAAAPSSTTTTDTTTTTGG